MVLHKVRGGSLLSVADRVIGIPCFQALIPIFGRHELFRNFTQHIDGLLLVSQPRHRPSKLDSIRATVSHIWCLQLTLAFFEHDLPKRRLLHYRSSLSSGVIVCDEMAVIVWIIIVSLVCSFRNVRLKILF